MARLDLYLCESGRVESRSLAAKLIKDGCVLVNGKVCKKSAFPVGEEDEVLLQKSDLTRFVSRGGLKLERALDEFQIDPKGLVCADLGASTGGFTDCLLQRGAKKVFAVDAGTAQLHPRLREREEVVVMENTNARYLTEESFGRVDLAVMDVSFISQTLLYPSVRRILRQGGVFVSLVKPQFEAGREHLSRGGIVKSEKARLACLEKIRAEGEKHGLILQKTTPSPIPGGDGNLETLAYFLLQGKIQ